MGLGKANRKHLPGIFNSEIELAKKTLVTEEVNPQPNSEIDGRIFDCVQDFSRIWQTIR
jgi:hypothetical protein